MLRFIASAHLLGVVVSTRLGAQAALKGTVLTDADERPIASAEIVVTGLTRSARSDSTGAFRLTGIASGAHEVIVRHAGYAPWSGSLTFHDGETVDVDFLLKATVVTLEKVEVKATLRDLRLRDFEERRKEGFGRFITGDTFQRNFDRQMSTILAGEIAGLRMIGLNNGKIVSTTREAGPCYVQVIINDMPRYRNAKTDEAFDINSLDPADILGLEYYTLAATPVRFSGTGGVPDPPKGVGPPLGFRNPREVQGGPACGTLVIWTK